MAVLLPLPDDPRLAMLFDEWPNSYPWNALPHPRSAWLREFEQVLLTWYPQSSSRDRSLTARHYAPFPLAAGHDVP